MNKEEIKIITLGDIFDNLETEEQAFKFLKYIKNQQQELDKYKNIVDEIKILSNQVKEEAKEVENEWCYQVMKKIDYLIELKGSDN